MIRWSGTLPGIQGLDLTLFVDAEYDRLLRGVEVQAHYIGHLFQKLRIARKLKGFRTMGLEIVGAPDIVHRGLADALALRQGPGAGVVCRVASTMAAILSMEYRGFRP